MTTAEVAPVIDYGFHWEEKKGGPDESLYSRQLYVMDVESMLRLAQYRVLVCGLSGLGVEISKNIILAGAKSVTVWDDKQCTFADLASQFYLNEGSIGQNRAEASLGQLRQLNPYVTVEAATSPLSEEFLSGFQCIVFVDNGNEADIIRVSSFCHAQNKHFIFAEARGVFGEIFVDLGANHLVRDPTGEQPFTGIIAGIESDGTVTCHEDSRHGMEDGNSVRITEVVGMPSVNKTFKISVSGPYTFKLFTAGADGAPDVPFAAAEGEVYERNGVFTQVIVPVVHNFKSYADSVYAPGELPMTDFAKMESPAQIHLGFRGLHDFQATNGYLPRPGNAEDAAALVARVEAINAERKAIEGSLTVETVNAGLISQLARGARGQLNPMAAFLGGVVAQEVLKASSGKFTPLKQWLAFDAVETLPAEPLPEAEYAATNTRYDGQIFVFGQTFQQKLINNRIFMVGAGALGCELFKNFAMQGLGTGPRGSLFVTDMDTIERSNLNRQFLFRDENVGDQKSVAITNAIKKMNPDVKVTNYVVPVGPDSENLFGDEFFAGIDCVVNALDNIKARLYMDARCVFYEKPLLESGTMGTKANAQMVLPHLSENYGASQDPPDKGIPMCTLKNFPNEINHTIEWARDLFNGFFTNGIMDTINYLDGGAAFLEALPTKVKHVVERRAILENITSNLALASGQVTWDDCIAWARLAYQDLYDNKIVQLLHSYPLDYKTKEGNLFWSGPKRAPCPLPFNPNDNLSMAFVIAAANIRASNFGIVPPADQATNPEYFKASLAKLVVPAFSAKSGVVIESDPKAETAGGGADDEAVIAQLIASLPKPDPSLKAKLIAADFEKDVDANFHIDFVTACSNMRARNYSIPEANRQKTKGIAGRIIPAIATTTAMVTGLVGLEFYKLQKASIAIGDFKNAFVNLALPLFLFSEPLPPKKTRAREIKETYSAARRAAEEQLPVAVYPPEGFTPWSKLVVDKGPLTVQQFIDAFRELFGGLDVDSIACGQHLVYSSAFKKHADRKAKLLSEVYETSSGKPLNAVKGLLLAVTTQNDTEVPPVYYKFN